MQTTNSSYMSKRTFTVKFHKEVIVEFEGDENPTVDDILDAAYEEVVSGDAYLTRDDIVSIGL